MGKRQERGTTRINRKPVRINYDKLLKDLQKEKETANLSLVEKTLLKQQNEKVLNNIKETSFEVVISEEEKLKRRRESLMNNNQNKYIYSSKLNLLHDKDCTIAKQISDDEFEMLSELDLSKSICEKCHRMLLLRTAIANDDQKNIHEYYKFFKGAANNKILHTLIIDNNAKFEFTDNYLKNCIKIKVNEDTWLLKKDSKGNFSLYHNNYVRLEGNKRNFISGYHLQRDKNQLKNPKSVYYLITLICGYSYDEHLDIEHSKTDDKILYGFECPLWIKRLIKEIREIQRRKEN